jgi:hypothetical protein
MLQDMPAICFVCNIAINPMDMWHRTCFKSLESAAVWPLALPRAAA